ncbi:ABC transporter substrate-binding protein [Fulvivirgaceae bacterium BMA10]|uniref:ABC transporter substrate-binding protein n=1 Tax=Splendidivirga corallicola TaxID=3051826 RepID=A0ABT8KX12_9BACT|nr:ABC transporter substrate-binding protein [Fulvivirgaceae bacterium BMA10]
MLLQHYKNILCRTILLLQIIGCFFVIPAIGKNVFPTEKKIITAGGEITEIVCALGDCDKIIAIDRMSNYPSKVLSLPSIGYRGSINAEGIIALQPDLVLVKEGYVKDEVIAQLKSTDIDIRSFKNENNIQSTKKLIREIAQILGRESQGEKLINDLDKQLVALKKLVRGVSSKPKLVFVYARGSGTINIAGKGTFAEAISTMVNAELATPEVQGYKPLNTEALVKADPDFLVFFHAGLKSIGGIPGALKIPGVAQTTAGKFENIVSIDGVKLALFGPRIVEAAEELALLIHPNK